MLYEAASHASPDILQKRLKIQEIITQNDFLKEVNNPAWLDIFDTIYTSDRPEFDVVPYPIFNWGRDVMRRYVSHIEPGSGEEDGVVRKTIYHIPEVTRTGIAIARNSEGLGIDINQAATCVYLHDIARAAQWYHFLTFKDAKSFDHAQVGAEMIMKANLPFNAVNLQEARVLDAVADHSKRSVTNRDIYLQLTRDADKIIILGEQLADFNELERRGNLNHSTISDTVLDQFIRGELVLNGSVSTQADHIVQKLSWLHDINLPASKRIAVTNGVFEHLKNNLAKVTEVPQVIADEVGRFTEAN